MTPFPAELPAGVFLWPKGDPNVWYWLLTPSGWFRVPFPQQINRFAQPLLFFESEAVKNGKPSAVPSCME